MKGKYYSQVIKVMTFIIDFWLINLAFFVTREWGVANTLSTEQLAILFIIFGLIWIIAGFFTKIYRIDTSSLIQNISINLFGTFILHFLLFGSILLMLSLQVSAAFLVPLYVISAAFIIGFRVAYKLVLKYLQFTGFDQRKVIIMGVKGSGTALYEYFTNNETA